MAIQQTNGNLGEFMAAKWLYRQGYKIFKINYRVGHLEVDIIATDEKNWIFVEVKTKTFTNFLHPENSVHKTKRDNLIRAAKKFMIQNTEYKKVRFDIISIILVKYGVQMVHFKDAFFPIQPTKISRKSSAYLATHGLYHQ
jgi:putative endonuclease